MTRGHTVVDVSAAGPAEYRLTFTTGNKTGAGTDATVNVELIGVGGAKSGDLTMDREPALFENKCVDSFNRVVEKDLGDLSQILVWHDGKGGGMFGSMMSGWYLEKVRVEHALTERAWEADFNEWIYGKREKGLTKKLELKEAGLDADELRKKAEAARASVEELNNLRMASPRKDAAGAAAAAAAAAAATAKDGGGASSSRSEPVPAPIEPVNNLPLGKYEVTLKPTEKTRSAAEGCPVPLEVRIVGRAGEAELTIQPGAQSRRTLAVGDVTQVCVAAERPLSRGETFDIDFVTVEALPDAKPHTVTFAVNAGLDEGHHELREQPAEEWEEAVAKKDGVPRKYWYSKARNASEWREPLKYYPVRFKERAKEADRVGGGTPGQTPRKK